MSFKVDYHGGKTTDHVLIQDEIAKAAYRAGKSFELVASSHVAELRAKLAELEMLVRASGGRVEMLPPGKLQIFPIKEDGTMGEPVEMGRTDGLQVLMQPADKWEAAQSYITIVPAILEGGDGPPGWAAIDYCSLSVYEGEQPNEIGTVVRVLACGTSQDGLLARAVEVQEKLKKEDE